MLGEPVVSGEQSSQTDKTDFQQQLSQCCEDPLYLCQPMCLLKMRSQPNLPNQNGLSWSPGMGTSDTFCRQFLMHTEIWQPLVSRVWWQVIGERQVDDWQVLNPTKCVSWVSLRRPITALCVCGGGGGGLGEVLSERKVAGLQAQVWVEFWSQGRNCYQCGPLFEEYWCKAG